MRLGILTGGGDCPGLNAVVRAAVALAARSEFNRLVSLQGTRFLSVPLSVVRRGARPVDADLLEIAPVFSG